MQAARFKQHIATGTLAVAALGAGASAAAAPCSDNPSDGLARCTNVEAPKPKWPGFVSQPPPPAWSVAANRSDAAPVRVEDCKAVAAHVREGDVVMRGSTSDRESSYIGRATLCPISHAGIVARDPDSGELVVVDAYPRSPVIDKQPVENFFCHGTQGHVSRPIDAEGAVKASQWALAQTRVEGYQFDLFDSWRMRPKVTYCADFVRQALNAGGIDAVPEAIDMLRPDLIDNTINVIREFDRSLGNTSMMLLILGMLHKTGGESQFVTPCQVGVNAQTRPVVDFVQP